MRSFHLNHAGVVVFCALFCLLVDPRHKVIANFYTRGIHITLFARGCVDKYLHRDAVDWHRYNGWELPWYEESRPTEVVVKYVHVCPKCDREYSPGGGDHEDEKVADRKQSSKKGRGKESIGVPSIVVTK